MSDEPGSPCPVCGAPNPADAAFCGACGYALSEASSTTKVDALLEDLMDLSKSAAVQAEPETVPDDAPDVDEEVAEKLFDSLLVEIQPAKGDEAAEVSTTSTVAEVPEVVPEVLADVARVPVAASPADTEGGKLLGISGRMFDAVTFGSVAALVATFVGFRMYQNIFDPTRPWTAILFVGIAAAGMASAIVLYHLSNSEVALGDRLVKLGRHQEALVHYERAIRMVRRPSYAWTSRGVAMKYLGRLNDALRCHENAIRLDPENEVAWCNLGTVYCKKAEFGKALECYDKALRIRPKYAIAWNNKGVVLARMNQFEEANRCHEKATSFRPTYVAAWLNRGEVLARLGAQEEAQRCLEKARSISRGVGARATTAT